MLLAVHAIFKIIVLFLAAIMLFNALKRPEVPASRAFACVMTFEMLALAASTVTMLIGDPTLKIAWNETRFIGLSCIGPWNFIFISRLLGKSYVEKKRLMAVLFVIPVIAVTAAFTNEYHHLFRRAIYVMYHQGVGYISSDPGPLYWLTMLYSYVMIAVTLALMIVEQLKKPAMYRGQINVMLLSVTATVLFNVWLVMGFIVDYSDSSTTFFALAGISEYWGLFLYKPKGLLNGARELAVDSMNNAVMVFDYHEKLLNCNPKATELFAPVPGIALSEFFSARGLAPDVREFTEGDLYFEIDNKSVYDGKNRFAGRVLVCNDVTRLKKSLFEIEAVASRDRLTGLRNEYAFLNELRRVDAEGLAPLCICCCHIANIKLMNEVFGAGYGDEMIKLTAKEVAARCRPNDICARLRGGEFVIVFDGMTGDEAEEVLNEIEQSLRENAMPVIIIYGTAVKRKPRENIAAVLQAATDGMYKQKLLRDSILYSYAINPIRGAMRKRGLSVEHEDEIYELSRRLCLGNGMTRAGEDEQLRRFIELHDVGMLNVPEEICKKSGSLSNSEWETAKLHTIRGYHIAMSMPELAGLARDILSHHERYDGLGYPNRLKGAQIPLFCRIYPVVAFYIENQSSPDVFAQLEKYSGSRFDPEMVERLTEIVMDSE